MNRYFETSSYLREMSRIRGEYGLSEQSKKFGMVQSYVIHGRPSSSLRHLRQRLASEALLAQRGQYTPPGQHYLVIVTIGSTTREGWAVS